MPSPVGILYDFERNLLLDHKATSARHPKKGFWIHEFLYTNRTSYSAAMFKNWKSFCQHSDTIQFLGKPLNPGTYLSFTQYCWNLKQLGLIEPVSVPPHMELPERGARQAGKKRQFYHLSAYDYAFGDPSGMPREWASPLQVLAEQRGWDSKF